MLYNFMFIFTKYDRQNHVWSFMTKYLRFLCKFTSWSCGCIDKQIRCWKNCWYSYNIDKCNTILCLSSRNMIDKTMCEVQFSLKNDLWSFLTFWFIPPQNSSPRSGGKLFLRENWFEMSDLFSSLLIFTIIKTILSKHFLLFLNFTKIL